MKTALYTIFRCTNYGAVLQAFALATTLRRMLGVDGVDVVNHLMDPRDNHLLGKTTNPATPALQRWLNRRKAASRYFRPDLFEERRQKTVRLIEREIRPTARLYRNPGELRGLPACRTVVVGSDQVWNPGLNHDFGRNQYLATCLPDGQDRVAYAASFGVAELPPQFRAEYAGALRRFRSITVREESGAAICESLVGVRPEVVLDPTLLLTGDEWLGAVGGGSRREGGGVRRIAAYWVRRVCQADVDALSRMAQAHGAEVLLMSAGPLPKLDFPGGVSPLVEADPFDFVRTVADADAVATDSFHGLQFATLFRRPFLALGEVGDRASNVSRLTDFCARYGIADGVRDIARFRAGDAFGLAGFGPFDGAAFAADRSRSLKALEGMLA